MTAVKGTVRCAQCGLRHDVDLIICPVTGKRVDDTGQTLAKPAAPVLPDFIGSTYQVVEMIGQGASGIVYRARDLAHDREVAIKHMHGRHRYSEKATLRFLREAKVASAIGHPNVVRYFDVGNDTDQTPYLVMELLEGESLAALLERKRTLEVVDAIEIVTQVLSGLSAAHAVGVVHRDLTPQNVFLCNATAGRRVKILDFGVSKLIENDMGHRLTATGDVIGTPFYLSPEQASGQSVDHRSDLWAAGVLLFETLTGTCPFEADSFVRLILKITVDPVPEAASLRPDLPDAIDPFLARALAKAPEDRFASAGDMVAALRRVLRDLRANELADTQQTPAASLTSPFEPPRD